MDIVAIAADTTTTSSVDVGEFEQILGDEDLSIPCEADNWHHRMPSDSPAAWATWWDALPCGHSPGFLLMCGPCVNHALTRTNYVTRCNICAVRWRVSIRSILVRMEPIR